MLDGWAMCPYTMISSLRLTTTIVDSVQEAGKMSTYNKVMVTFPN